MILGYTSVVSKRSQRYFYDSELLGYQTINHLQVPFTLAVYIGILRSTVTPERQHVYVPYRQPSCDHKINNSLIDPSPPRGSALSVSSPGQWYSSHRQAMNKGNQQRQGSEQ